MRRFLLLLILLPIMAKAQPSNTIRSVILPGDSTWAHALWGAHAKTWTPAATDITQAEALLSDCFSKAQKAGQFDAKRKLPEYTRQYIGGVDGNGHQVIWINCFCSTLDPKDSSWKTQVYGVDDGGDCYFSVKIDLTEKKYFDLVINGNA